jgi:hypothetical protein
LKGLEHEKARITRSIHGFLKSTKSYMEKILPKSASATLSSTFRDTGTTESLEVLAAFEVLPAEVKKVYQNPEFYPEITKVAEVR